MLRRLLSILTWPIESLVERLLDLVTRENRVERALAGFSWFDLFVPRPGSEKEIDPPSLQTIASVKQMLLDEVTPETRQFRSGLLFDTATPPDVAARALSEGLIRNRYFPAVETMVRELRNAATAKEELLRLRAAHVTEADYMKLKCLWEALMDSDAPSPSSLTNTSSAWSHLGFQSNPIADFRGMGTLGLEAHLFFSSAHRSRAREVLLRSHTPGLWFPFATTGINVTAWLVSFLEEGLLDVFFFESMLPTLETFGTLYAYFLLDFSRFWHLNRPKDIMQFGQVSAAFRINMRAFLLDVARHGMKHHVSMVSRLKGDDLVNELRKWIDGDVHRASGLGLTQGTFFPDQA